MAPIIKPRLSVAIPTYNRAALLQVCLDSLVKQASPGVELVVCDNASTDDTVRILGEYRARYPEIRVFVNEKNLGPDSNILRCLKESRGGFIFLLSDDDFLLPGGLLNVLRAIHDSPRAGMIHLNTKNFAGNAPPSGAPFYDLKQNAVFENKDEFLKYINVQATFLSAMVLNGGHFRAIKNPEKYVGTYLLQAHVAVSCAGAGDRNTVVAQPCVAYREGNSGGYSVFRVFADEWKRVLFVTGASAGFSKSALRSVYAKTIRSFLRPMAMRMKLDNSSLEAGYLFNLTWVYPSAWIFLYPVFIMPAWMVRLVDVILKRRKTLLRS